MDETVRSAPAPQAANALVVYDPRRAGRARIGRVASGAKTMLAVWGAVSLAGIVVAPLLHDATNLAAFAHVGRQAATAPEQAPARPASASAAQPAPARTQPSTISKRAAPAVEATAVREAPIAAFTEKAVSSRPEPLPAVTPAPRLVEPDLAKSLLAEATALARLPRSRPDEPITTGSIGQRETTDIRRRIRKLHELRFRYAASPYRASPSPPLRRRPPPLLYQW